MIRLGDKTRRLRSFASLRMTKVLLLSLKSKSAFFTPRTALGMTDFNFVDFSFVMTDKALA